MIVAGIGVVEVGIEAQVGPAALLLEGDQLLDGRAGDDHERHALVEVGGDPGHRVEQVRAHGAGALALRPEHEAVGAQGRLVAEQVGEADRAFLALEPVVAGDLAAGRQGAALGGDALQMATQLVLLLEQGGAGGAVLGALIGEADRAVVGELGGGDQGRGLGVHGASRAACGVGA